MAVHVVSPEEIGAARTRLGEYRPVAQVDMTATDFTAKLGVDFMEDREDGLGAFLFQCFRVDNNGPYFILWHGLEGPLPHQTVIESLFDYANQKDKGKDDLAIILKALDIPPAAVTWQLDEAMRQEVITEMRGKIGLSAPPLPQP